MTEQQQCAVIAALLGEAHDGSGPTNLDWLSALLADTTFDLEQDGAIEALSAVRSMAAALTPVVAAWVDERMVDASAAD
jgi:hypothetical protein